MTSRRRDPQHHNEPIRNSSYTFLDRRLSIAFLRSTCMDKIPLAELVMPTRARAVLTFSMILFSLLASYSESLYAQPRTDGITHYRRIVDMLNRGDVAALADLVVYPLRRPNPLPDIRSRVEFIAYYHVLFDADFVKRLAAMDTVDVFEHHGNFGVFAGDIYLDEEGRIITINHNSPAELGLLESETKRAKSNMHTSIREWNRNVLVYQCSRYTVRIDETSGGLRFASWNKGRSTRSSPDLILYDGTTEFYGTQGGVGYKFKSGEWAYLIEHLDVCEDGTTCGPMLTISRRGNVVRSYECTASK